MRLDERDREHGQHMAEAVWRLGQQVYGERRWNGAQGPRPPYAWVKALARFTRAEVANGMEALLTRWPDYTPSLGSFSEACRPHSTATGEQRALYARIEEQEQGALPNLTELANVTATGRAWLALMVMDGVLTPERAWTQQELTDALVGFDPEAMRAQVRVCHQQLRELYGLEDGDATGS